MSGAIPGPGVGEGERLVVEFGPGKTTPETKSTPAFIAKPGSPRLTRIITMSRAKTMGSRGTAPNLAQWSNRELQTSDTMSAFAPMYQQFAKEFSAFKTFTPTQLEAVIKKLEEPRISDIGLLRELEEKCPGITNALYNALLPQYSRGEIGIVDNILSLGDAGILQRFNGLGFGTQLRAEMLAIINNSQFFKDIDVSIKDNDIKIVRLSDNLTLVEGHVDTEKKLMTLKINSQVGPEDRDEAIKHLVMMAACHSQQNNSNIFMPTFGENIYENIRLLQLAIGEFNMRIPQHFIDSQLDAINRQINAIANPEEKKNIQEAWDLWSSRAELFKEKISPDGIKIIDNNHRPTDPQGHTMNLSDIQQMLRDEVTESIFPVTKGLSMEGPR